MTIVRRPSCSCDDALWSRSGPSSTASRRTCGSREGPGLLDRLGASASKGSSNNWTDGVEAFDLPANCTAATFGGFASPIATAPAVNSVNAGSTVPVKFTVQGFRALGVRAFGSDYPVFTMEVVRGIHAAALRRYSVDGAYASGEAHEKGTLAPGRVADLVVLSEDVFAIPIDRLWAVKAMTPA